MVKVSVIIPVYNKEQYLGEALDSVINQTLDSSDVEIICIDDGSTDSSKYVIKQYQTQYDNIVLLSQANRGVSSARNTGMDAATGKYMVFLDADDMLSANNLEDLSVYFDEIYDDTEILTYNLHYKHGEEIKVHPRGAHLSTNCIVDITKNIHFSQTTMNICVKGTTNIRFDEKLSLCEDQLFCLLQMVSKNSIGWCSSAAYIYRRDVANEGGNIKYNMAFAYDYFMHFVNEILGMSNEHTIAYISSLILYNINWRLKADMLFPYDDEAKYDNFLNFLKNTLNLIANKHILNCIWLSHEHKYYLLSLKSKNRPFAIFESDKMTLCDNSGQILEEKNCFLVVQRERLIDNKFYIMGFLKNHTLNFSEKPRLFAYIHDKKIEIDLYDSIHSHWRTKIKTQKHYGFECTFTVDHATNIYFKIQFLDYFYPLNFYFRPNHVLSSEKNVLIHPSNKFTLQAKGQHLCFFSNILEGKALSKAYFNALNLNKKTYCLRKMSQFLHAKKKIFLYIDSMGIYDNAYYQFKHDIQKDDHVEKYYITFEEDRITKKFTSFEKKFVVPWNSWKHKLLLLSCSTILTSNSGHPHFIPFREDFHLYIDLLKFETIYLQHGTMHADCSFYNAKDALHFVDKIVISTAFEKNAMLQILHYPEKDVLTTGMPRYSVLQRNHASGKIIFVPSWREYLLKYMGPAKWIKKENIGDCKYMIETLNFLNYQPLHDFLEKNNVILDVKLHKMFDSLKDDFIVKHKNIQFCSEINIGDYNLAISDFSSIMYDFAFLNIPILRFIPDMELIQAGYHSYREFFFDIFGDKDLFSKTSAQLMHELQKIHTKNYTVNYDRARIGFFENCSHATENIYKILKAAGGGNG